MGAVLLVATFSTPLHARDAPDDPDDPDDVSATSATSHEHTEEVAHDVATSRCVEYLTKRNHEVAYVYCKEAKDLLRAELRKFEEQGRVEDPDYAHLLRPYAISLYNFAQATERLAADTDACKEERRYADLVAELEAAQALYIDYLRYTVEGFAFWTSEQQAEYLERDEYYAELEREAKKRGTYERLTDEARAIVSKCVYSRPAVDVKQGTLDEWLCEFGADEASHTKGKRQLIRYLEACDAAVDQGSSDHRYQRLVILDALIDTVGNDVIQGRILDRSELRPFGSDYSDCSLYDEQRMYAVKAEEDAVELLEARGLPLARVQELTTWRRKAAVSRESASALWYQCLEATPSGKPGAGAVAAMVGGVAFVGVGAGLAASFVKGASDTDYFYDFSRLGFALGSTAFGNLGIVVGSGGLAIRYFDPMRPSSRKRVSRRAWLLLTAGALVAGVGGALAGGAYNVWRVAGPGDDEAFVRSVGLARGSAVAFTSATSLVTAGLTLLGVATYSPNYPVDRRFKMFMKFSSRSRR